MLDSTGVLLYPGLPGGATLESILIFLPPAFTQVRQGTERYSSRSDYSTVTY